MGLVKFFNEWNKASEQTLRREYYVEYVLKNFGALCNDCFPEPEDFIEAHERSRVITITPEIDSMISYRSRTSSKEKLINLIRGYRSYPEFRNEQTVEDIYDGFKLNRTMEMPIVFNFSNCGMRVFSGNTRMDIAFQLGINPKVVLIEV